LADLLADLLVLRIIAVDGQGFADRVVDHSDVGHIRSPSFLDLVAGIGGDENPLAVHALDHCIQQPMLIRAVTQESRTILPTLVHFIGMGKNLGHVLDSTAQLRMLRRQRRPIIRRGADREPQRSCHLEEIASALAHVVSLRSSSVSTHSDPLVHRAHSKVPTPLALVIIGGRTALATCRCCGIQLSVASSQRTHETSPSGTIWNETRHVDAEC
jgi:hypothetical protein